MVYKKYIKRSGKIFGPYYYKSYRDKGGKVKTRFISGPKKRDRILDKMNNNLFLTIILILVILLIFLSGIYLSRMQDVKLENNPVSRIFIFMMLSLIILFYGYVVLYVKSRMNIQRIIGA